MYCDINFCCNVPSKHTKSPGRPRDVATTWRRRGDVPATSCVSWEPYITKLDYTQIAIGRPMDVLQGQIRPESLVRRPMDVQWTSRIGRPFYDVLSTSSGRLCGGSGQCYMIRHIMDVLLTSYGHQKSTSIIWRRMDVKWTSGGPMTRCNSESGHRNLNYRI